MTRIVLSLVLLIVPLCMCAQKKELAQAKGMIKKGATLDKAEQLMYNLLKDSTHRDNEKIWLTLFEAQKKTYDQGNEKLYLKQAYDTAALFFAAKRMFQTMEGLDSVDMKPDKHGKMKLVHRKKHANMLHLYRRNIFNGGTFFINKGKYKEAYEFFDLYVDCGRQPLFSEYRYNETDDRIPEAAYWAVYCGYKMADTKATLHHTYMALKDTAHYKYMLQYLAETYKREKDNTRYMDVLEEGFKKYPLFPFFFPRLLEYYSGQREWKKALDLCDRALAQDSTSLVFRFSKTSVLLNMHQYDACIGLCDELIASCDSLYGAYLNAGLAYYNQGVELDKALNQSADQRKQVRAYYSKALPYLTKYRKSNPDAIKLWGLPLYTIYLNLNMGKEFDEMEKLLK